MDTTNSKIWAFHSSNEVVGYKIVVDYYNWKVVLVKKKGEHSKEKGKEYVADVLGYYKSLDSACEAIKNISIKSHLEKTQSDCGFDIKDLEKAIARSNEALKESLERFKADIGRDVKELEEAILELKKKKQAEGLGGKRND